MTRRSLLKTAAAASAASWAARGLRAPLARAALPRMKITRIRYYESPISRDMINQSFHVITVETDAGITGIGEGGSRDLVLQAAQMIIGEDATQIDRLWQLMYRGLFYPAGREKIHAIGGLDVALWDIKGKALGVPVYELLGGLARDHVECYATGFPEGRTERDKARLCMQAGFRAYRTSVVGPQPGAGYNTRDAVRRTHKLCEEIRAGVGANGDWCIDYHTRLDFPDAVRLSTLLEPLEPLFCEDLVRSENPSVYRQLRPQVKVPIAVGEQFGPRWDFNELVEQRLVDYSRVSIPNCGGITEYMKIAAMCETHYVGLVPHFTGPIGETALVHCNLVHSGPVLMEMTGGGKSAADYLPQSFDFKNGKLWPNRRPGLGVELDAKRLKLLAEVTEKPTGTSPGIPRNKLYRRPDGSFTNW
jgi:L-alanine-DL-glutamate epimerase-like enolase superfamily enzyme